MSPQGNKAHIRRFVEEVINRKDLAAAGQYVADDFVELDPLPGQEQGLEGLRQWLGMYLAAFPDVHWTFEEQVAEGDRVVSRFTWRGTNTGPFIGMPPAGKRVEVSGVVIDRLADGKLKESRMLMNTLSMMQQLGAIPG